MLIITLHVDAPAGQAIGIKEDIAMYCERFGDTRVVDITDILPEQMTLTAETTKQKLNEIKRRAGV